MLPYWLLFLLPAWMAVEQQRPDTRYQVLWPARWWGVFFVLVAVIGLRSEVGADWIAYLGYVERGATDTLLEALTSKDPSYGLLNWAVARMGGNIYGVNTVCAWLFAWGLVRFCRAQPRPGLALVVSIPYLVIVVAMGYTRQGTAIGLVMAGLVSLTQGSTLRFVLWMVLAATFHKSAVVLIPLAALSATRNRAWTIAWVLLAASALFILMVQESLESLTVNYIGREYESQGAGVRVAMNALPGFLFLLFRSRFELPQNLKNFWTAMSYGALIFIALLLLSPSSTAVDRLALYWIPIQLFVWSRIPNVVGKKTGSNTGWTWVVVGYSALVQFVWLVFGSYSYTWLPYRFWPLEMWLGAL